NRCLRTFPTRRSSDLEYQAALKLKSDDGLVHNRLGNAYYSLERYAEAITQYKEATRLLPTEPTIWANLTDGYFELGQWADVLSADRKSTRLNSSHQLI